MPCGSNKKTRKTSRRETAAQKAKISAALKGKKGKKGRIVSAATRRKLSDAAKCRAATKGHCAKPRPSSKESAARKAASKRARLKRKARGHRECKASANTRHSKSTPRRLHIVVKHHVMRSIRTTQRAYRESWTSQATHVQGRMVRLAVRKAARAPQPTRPRTQHKQRLHCHMVYRKSTAKHYSVSKCPRSKHSKSKRR